MFLAHSGDEGGFFAFIWGDPFELGRAGAAFPAALRLHALTPGDEVAGE